MSAGDRTKDLPYRVGERVLCYHGPMIYEAKIMKCEIFEQKHPASGQAGPHYFIHYKGWKATWDEWVVETRILQYNDGNLAKQKQLKEMHTEKKKGGSSVSVSRQRLTVDTASASNVTTTTSAASTGSSSPTAPRGVKRPREKSIDKDESVKPPKFPIPIPEALMGFLVNDWENINKSRLLVPLPRNPSVVDIMNHYKQYRRDKSDPMLKDHIVDEVMQGIKLYFNKSLGTRLLYNHERKQYKTMRTQHDSLENSQIYGAEHLIRLFVTFPTIIALAKIGLDTSQSLNQYIGDFLNFLKDKRKEYFIDRYVKPE